jgi:putative tryptophan/tyrosine transport system substrate-binding protein
MRRREFIALIGSATAWPFAGRAQQRSKVHHIAAVYPTQMIRMMMESESRVFFAELQLLGYVEGINLTVDRFSLEGRIDIKELIRQAIRRGPEVIFTVGSDMAAALQDATKSIPIVAAVVDPIATGLTVSISRPGGNLTGVVIDAGVNVWEKRFEVLREITPAGMRVAFLATPDVREGPYGRAVRQAADRVGISLTLITYDNVPVQEAEYRRAFSAMREAGIGAIAIPDEPGDFAYRKLIVELVQDLRLPAVYPFREFIDEGGLMAYSPNLAELSRHAAHQVDQILKGVNPGDIPFFQATKFELIINLKTAKALGVTVPPSLLARADEVLE